MADSLLSKPSGAWERWDPASWGSLSRQVFLRPAQPCSHSPARSEAAPRAPSHSPAGASPHPRHACHPALVASEPH